ncbi:MAG: folate-binding protein [Pseudomonadota bacterium]
MSNASGLTGIAAPDRAVLQLAGADARAVLQGVVTNDVDAVKPGAAVYAALLTPQGKYLADFFMLDGGEDTVLLDVARNQAQTLGIKLKMYCLRRDANISVRNDLQVALIWGGETAPVLPEPAWSVKDPRDPALGWRAYGPDIPAVLQEVSVSDRAAYDALRITLNVPESGIELQAEQTFILEAGLERLHGVDFRKGCYVGQEVTARMKHKTELRKGLVRVRIEGTAPAGTPITASGKPVGTLFSSDGNQALAHLRYDRAGPDMIAGEAKVHFEQV